MNQSLIGFIDSITTGAVAGWIGTTSSNINDAVFSLHEGTVSRIVRPTIQDRRDVTSRKYVLGFSLPLDVETQAGIAADRLSIQVQLAKESSVLRLWKPADLALKVANLPAGQLARFTDFVNQLSAGKVDANPKGSGRPESETAPLLSVGMRSPDNVVAVGRDGVLFLAEGTNRVSDLYRASSTGTNTDAWSDTINKRAELASLRGFKYVQIIIPEKSSLLWWKTPFQAQRGSSALNALSQRLLETGAHGALFNVLDELPDDVVNESVFRNHDSHLSSAGARLLAERLSARLGFESTSDWQASDPCVRAGSADLSSRFSTSEEHRIEYATVYSDGLKLEPRLVRECNPKSGHIGISREWHCEAAPYKAKVICFGNSFFERGSSSTGLSWWFSRLFSQFTFCWQPDLDAELIEQSRPDAVICQTIERFLRRAPLS